MKLMLVICFALFSANVLAQESLPLTKKVSPAKSRYELYVPTQILYLDKETQEYITKTEFLDKYGRDAFRSLQIGVKTTAHAVKNQQAQVRGYVYKLKPSHTLAGCSMIGASVAAYALSNSIINQKIGKEDDMDKAATLNKTGRTIGYICAGVSVAGIVVLITGLHKEYNPNKGIAVANNCYIDANAGVSMALTF